ncbi:uncharacterized [Tachysurus ichikawai]
MQCSSNHLEYPVQCTSKPLESSGVSFWQEQAPPAEDLLSIYDAWAEYVEDKNSSSEENTTHWDTGPTQADTLSYFSLSLFCLFLPSYFSLHSNSHPTQPSIIFSFATLTLSSDFITEKRMKLRAMEVPLGISVAALSLERGKA